MVGAPVSFEGNYATISHKDGCPVKKIQNEINHSKSTVEGLPTNAKLTQMMNVAAPGSATATHTYRLLCACMSPRDFDAQICLEFMSRDLVFEAYAHLNTMAKKYGLQHLMEDTYLRLIAIQYLTICQLYYLMNSDAPLTAKAKKSGQKHDPANLKSVKLENDQLTDLIFNYPSYGKFGTLFDDILAGKPIPRPISEASGGPLYSGKWVPACSDPEFKVWYRIYQGAIDFRLEGIVDASLRDIISITSEVEMAKLWMPSIKYPFAMGLKEAKCIGRFGRFKKVSLYQVELPRPLTNVEVVVQGSLIDDLEKNNKLVVCMSSFDIDKASEAEKATWPIKIPPVAPKYERVQFGGGCVFEPIGSKKISMKTVWTVNMDQQPSTTILHFVASKFLKKAFLKFNDTVSKYSREFAVKQKEDPWLYGHLERRIAELKDVGLDPLMNKKERSKLGDKKQGYQTHRAESTYLLEQPAAAHISNAPGLGQIAE